MLKLLLRPFFRLFLIVAGVLLALNGLYLSKIANFNMGLVFTSALGVLMILWGLLFRLLPRWFNRLIFTLCVLELGFCAGLALYGGADRTDYSEDAVIVLGAAVRGSNVSLPLADRLNLAVNYHAKNPSALIVVSGGQGPQEDVTEASAMAQYLVGRGVNPDVIVLEDRSSSTLENLTYSKALLDARLDGEYRTLIVTNAFHALRAEMTARRVGINAAGHLGAGVVWYSVVPNYLRETAAIVKFLIN